jgi:hypothetical protein
MCNGYKALLGVWRIGWDQMWCILKNWCKVHKKTYFPNALYIVNISPLLDFLTDSPQVVRVGTSATLTLNTGAPQGCVLSSLLYSLFTHDCAGDFLLIYTLPFIFDIFYFNSTTFLKKIMYFNSMHFPWHPKVLVSRTGKLPNSYIYQENVPVHPYCLWSGGSTKYMLCL